MTKALWWTLALALVACGGDGGTKDEGTAGDDDDDLGTGPIECEETFTPCGGDPSGSWEVIDFCTVNVEEFATCPDLVVTIVEDRSSGTVDIRSDGSYSRTYNVDLDAQLAIPTSCIAPIPCALLPPASLGLISACTEDTANGLCNCDASVAEVDSADGTWVVEGTDLVTDGTDHNPFCVEGPYGLVEDEFGTQVRWHHL